MHLVELMNSENDNIHNHVTISKVMLATLVRFAELDQNQFDSGSSWPDYKNNDI